MESKQAVLGFAALAQETRLELMRLLAARGASSMAAGELAAALGQPPSTLSFHLAALEQAQLIQSTRRGRQLIYAVRFFGLRSLFSFLTETCCSGRPELCGDLARLFPDDLPEDDHMTATFNVLFLCTHNSARSLMAQAILEKIGRGKFNSYSAGSEPARSPMPEVIQKLVTLGHDVSGLHCKSWNRFMGPDAPQMDFVITLCDTMQGQDCPGGRRQSHHGCLAAAGSRQVQGHADRTRHDDQRALRHDPAPPGNLRQPAARLARPHRAQEAARRDGRQFESTGLVARLHWSADLQVRIMSHERTSRSALRKSMSGALPAMRKP